MASTQAQTKRHSDIVAELQLQVANALVLYMNYKHYHWQVYGPLFRDLHLLFDEFATQTLETIDDFAERIRMIGEDPVSDPREIVNLTTMSIAAKGKRTMREFIDEADENVKKIIVELRRAGVLADEDGDIGTNDLFSRTVQIFEKQEWYLRDILEKGDKLVS
jgi:starvation-inducible DNA-binding protein